MGRDALLYAKLMRATAQEAVWATSSNPALIELATARQNASESPDFPTRQGLERRKGVLTASLSTWPVIAFQRHSRARSRDCKHLLRPYSKGIFGLLDEKT